MTPEASGLSPWADAVLIAALFAVDPVGLGGVVVRGGPGPARDRWMALARSLLPPEIGLRRMPPHIDDDRLLGGLDLPASLAAGRPVARAGLLAECDGGVVVLPMAERMADGAAARLAAALDHQEIVVERDGMALRLSARIGAIALDEGVTPDERPPDALLERLAFRMELDAAGRGATDDVFDASSVPPARRRLRRVAPAEGAIVEAVCAVAERLGNASVRGPILALRAARAHAALHGRRVVTAEDAAVACRLVLVPRASAPPAEAQPAEAQPDGTEENADAPPEPPPDLPSQDDRHDESEAADATEMAIEAIEAALPDDLLSRLKVRAEPRAASRGGGAGAAARSAVRGRPVGSRGGSLTAGARLDLVETLRAAAPWQRLRREGAPSERRPERRSERRSGRIQVRRSDFRIRAFVQRRESTTIFVVDASGSTAFQRLAEAKGAVELLLAKAYVSRARVALVAFRGAEAEVLLPPTRSLTRAKARLADLPGGGGTPLAAGVEAALVLAQAEKTRQHTPLLVFLTDGRANVALDGAPDRAAAEADAMAAARNVRAAGVAAVFIDTSARTQPDSDRFARAMNALYAPLPYVDAGAVLGLVSDFQPAGR